MHYSPGAPILRSYDLVHREYVGHSIPTLNFSPAYDLTEVAPRSVTAAAVCAHALA